MNFLQIRISCKLGFDLKIFLQSAQYYQEANKMPSENKMKASDRVALLFAWWRSRGSSLCLCLLLAILELHISLTSARHSSKGQKWCLQHVFVPCYFKWRCAGNPFCSDFLELLPFAMRKEASTTSPTAELLKVLSSLANVKKSKNRVELKPLLTEILLPLQGQCQRADHSQIHSFQRKVLLSVPAQHASPACSQLWEHHLEEGKNKIITFY